MELKVQGLRCCGESEPYGLVAVTLVKETTEPWLLFPTSNQYLNTLELQTAEGSYCCFVIIWVWLDFQGLLEVFKNRSWVFKKLLLFRTNRTHVPLCLNIYNLYLRISVTEMEKTLKAFKADAPPL